MSHCEQMTSKDTQLARKLAGHWAISLGLHKGSARGQESTDPPGLLVSHEASKHKVGGTMCLKDTRFWAEGVTPQEACRDFC